MGGTTGQFVWYDLMTTDLEAAKAFYTKVVGWGVQEWTEAPEGMPPYTMWTVGDAPIGGMNELPADALEHGARPHWLSYVRVDDVDATLSKATEMGATVVMRPTDLPSIGRMAIFSDPQGPTLAVFRPEGESPRHEGDPRPGDFSWHELMTTDAEAAWIFYSSLFGWEETTSFDMGDGWMYQMYGAGGTELGGMFNKPEDMPGPPYWLYYATVSDIDTAAETVTTEGGKILNGPEEVPGGGRIAQCRDPQGAAFAIYEPAE